MNRSSELECYLYFMWNVWSKEVCEEMYPCWYDPTYDNYLWGKWCIAVEKSGGNTVSAAAQFYADVDANIRKRLSEEAMSHYNQ